MFRSMKRLTFLITICLMLLFTSCATIQTLTKSKSLPEPATESTQKPKSVCTYGGEFDPMVFFSWSSIRNWVHGEHIHVLIINPDEKSDVPIIEMILVELIDNPYGKHRVIAYRYLKGKAEIEYVFYLDEKGHYEQIEPPKAKRI